MQYILWGEMATSIVSLLLLLCLIVVAVKSFIVHKSRRGLHAICGMAVVFVLWFSVEEYLGDRYHYLMHSRTYCEGNLHHLDLALQTHCYPPVEMYPTNLAELSPAEVAPKLFVCPRSGNRPGDLKNVMEWTDYIYVSGVGPAAPSEIPVLICPPMFHPAGGDKQHPIFCSVMLMGDHSIACSTWYTNNAFHVDKLIEDPLAFCKNPPPGLRSNIYVHVSKRIEEQSKGKYKSHGLK